MKPREDEVRLRHMLDYAREAVDLAADRSRSELDSDRTLNLSLVRLVEVVGEAAARVTIEGRRLLPEIPWVEIVGLRNRLVHGYDAVDFDILWDILTDDLPPLVRSLEGEFSSEQSRD
jgi:Uncharacterized conserved protein